MKICSNKKEKQPRFLSRFQERQKASGTIVEKHRRPAVADKASGKNRHGVECSANRGVRRVDSEDEAHKHTDM